MKITQDACIDLPSTKDYHYEDILGWGEMKDQVLLNLSKVYNQWEKHTPDTTYGCVNYGGEHCKNELNAFEAKQHWVTVPETDPATTWQNCLDNWAVINRWWSLQGWLNMAVKTWLISGYAKVSWINWYKQALNNSNPILTGTNSINWDKTAENWFLAVWGTCYGHCIMGTGYTDIHSFGIIRNSYGDKWWKKGHFYFNYNDFNLLYSCYAIFWVEHKDLMEKLKTEKNRDEAYKRGYWNWLRGTDMTTRMEGYYLASNLWVVNWSGNNPSAPITRQDYAYMISHATGKKFKPIGMPYELITRSEASSWLLMV